MVNQMLKIQHFQRIFVFLTVLASILFAQNEKYHGGEYDGSDVYSMPSASTLNGETISVEKYSGGEQDGYNALQGVISQLDGASIEISKFRGGENDGYSSLSGIITQLNGVSIQIVKYQGGSYDGNSNKESDIFYLSGIIFLNSAKYAGGSYDGSMVVNSPLSQLDGFSISLVKYQGGGYDGYASIVSFSDISLPVTLTLFSLEELPNQTVVKIEWRTESEIENAYWLLLRKTENDSTLQELSKIDGQGNSSTVSDYSYKDSNVEAGSNYTYQLADVSINGSITYHEEKSIAVSVPKLFELFQNYPNPFNPLTNIKFALPVAAKVKIEVFNLLGQHVATILNANKPAGYHVINFDANRFSSGLYFYTIQTDNFHMVKKMMLVK